MIINKLKNSKRWPNTDDNDYGQRDDKQEDILRRLKNLLIGEKGINFEGRFNENGHPINF